MGIGGGGALPAALPARSILPSPAPWERIRQWTAQLSHLTSLSSSPQRPLPQGKLWLCWFKLETEEPEEGRAGRSVLPV